MRPFGAENATSGAFHALLVLHCNFISTSDFFLFFLRQRTKILCLLHFFFTFQFLLSNFGPPKENFRLLTSSLFLRLLPEIRRSDEASLTSKVSRCLVSPKTPDCVAEKNARWRASTWPGPFSAGRKRERGKSVSSADVGKSLRRYPRRPRSLIYLGNDRSAPIGGGSWRRRTSSAAPADRKMKAKHLLHAFF